MSNEKTVAMTEPGTATECTALATLPVRTMADIEAVGTAMAQSGMFGLKNNAQGMVLAMTCVMEKITPMQFKRRYHVHEDGTTSMRADAMAAEFRARGGRYTVREHSTTRAAALFEFDGNKIEAEFTMADAERHGYNKTAKGEKHNYAKHPENMLWARLISDNVRLLCPEAVAGVYVPEEVDAFTERTETPVNPDRAAALVPPRKDEAVEVKAEVVEDEKPAAAPTAKPDKAAKPVKAAPAPEPTPFDPPVAADSPLGIDFAICPIPPFKGQAWCELETKVLKHALKTAHADLRDGHRDAIQLIIKARAEAAAATQEG